MISRRRSKALEDCPQISSVHEAPESSHAHRHRLMQLGAEVWSLSGAAAGGPPARQSPRSRAASGSRNYGPAIPESEDVPEKDL
eukprot:2604154-Amphidinium_carterae.1